MSILIKGMEMPKEGTIIAIYKIDGKLYATRGLSGKLYPFVPVPPHGRLIDADEKIRVQIYDDQFEDFRMVDMTIDDLLSQSWVEADAPTIIEAEEGEN